jgi:phosphomannomutase / phosphoglucomutase
MNLNPHIFRAYDIRGIAHKPAADNPDLTPETVELIGKATGTYLLTHSGSEIVVGGDNRLSTPELKASFIKGLLSTGCNVTDIGVVSTPLLYFATCKLGMDGGINITASHNPKQYNGIKIVGKMAHAVCGDELQVVFNIAQERAFKDGKGTLTTRDDILDLYIEEMKEKIEIKKPLKVIIDAGNGVTGESAPALLRAFGCEVTELYCELDGNFPNHEANPEDEENLTDMIEMMKTGEYDIGIGFDGDGDRIGIVDEKGNHYAADLHLLLLAKDLLSREPGASIVFDVKASQIVPELIKKHGGIPIMAKTGHSFIEKTMHEKGALLAGEVSGHLFFAENYYGFDDAFMGALKTLAILSQDNTKLSEHFKDLPKTHATPEIKVPCPDQFKFDIVNTIRDHFTQSYDCITIDGVRILFDIDTWGIIRCSNTTPNITMRFEALTPEKLKEVIHIVAAELKKHPEVDMSWYLNYES